MGDKWQKGAYKSIIVNWKAKRKLMLGKEKLAKKKTNALQMMEQGSKDVEKKVRAMILESEQKCKEQIAAIKSRHKKDLATMKRDMQSLQDANRRLNDEILDLKDENEGLVQMIEEAG